MSLELLAIIFMVCGFIIPTIAMLCVFLKTLKNYKSYEEMQKDRKNAEQEMEKNSVFTITIKTSLIITVIAFFSMFFTGIFEQEVGYAFCFTMLLFVFSILAVYLIRKIDNIILLRKVKYNVNMDFPTNHSPAELSYILNKNIEKRKDLVSTIMSLIGKKYIKLDISTDKINFIDLKNNIHRLSDDEKYIYDWIISEDKSKYSYDEWKKIIKGNINNEHIYKYSETIYTRIKKIMFYVIPTFILIVISLLICNVETNIGIVLFIIFFVIFAILLIMAILSMFDDKESIYTKKGARIIKKWELFKKYLVNNSNLKNAEMKSVIIWDRYLAYAIVLDVNLNYDELNLDSISGMEFLKTQSLKDKVISLLEKTT